MPDTPGSLARAAQVAQPSNIISVATYGHSDQGGQPRRRFVMRVTGEGAQQVKARVRDAGIEALD